MLLAFSLQVAYETHWSTSKIFQRNSHSRTLYHQEDGGGERDRERNVERESNITFFLGLEINIKYNKWAIINEILIRILALIRVFFLLLDLLISNGNTIYLFEKVGYIDNIGSILHFSTISPIDSFFLPRRASLLFNFIEFILHSSLFWENCNLNNKKFNFSSHQWKSWVLDNFAKPTSVCVREEED